VQAAGACQGILPQALHRLAPPEVGDKFRYKICSKEGCRKPAVLAGRCAEHKKGAEATEAAAPAAPATT